MFAWVCLLRRLFLNLPLLSVVGYPADFAAAAYSPQSSTFAAASSTFLACVSKAPGLGLVPMVMLISQRQQVAAAPTPPQLETISTYFRGHVDSLTNLYVC
jgi:hypothetical protein